MNSIYTKIPFKLFESLTLFSQIGLSFLDGGNDHVADTSSWQSVKSGAETFDSDCVQVFGSGIVGTVDHSSDWQTERNSKFTTTNTTSTLKF